MKKAVVSVAILLCSAIAYAQSNPGRVSSVLTTTEQLPADQRMMIATQSIIPDHFMAVPGTSAGLIISATFDSSITSSGSAAAIESAINQAITTLQMRFRDPVTVSIYFRYATTDPVNGQPLGGGNLAQSYTVFYTLPWASFITALTNDSKTASDAVAVAHLPGSALTTLVAFKSANGRALGQNTPGAMDSAGVFNNGGTYDGIVTLNSGNPWNFSRPAVSGQYDAIRALEHEMDEVLGTGSFVGQPGVGTLAVNVWAQDIFSYSSSSVRNITGTGTRYVSIDGGATNIVTMNPLLNGSLNGDSGDWASGSCPQSTPYVQNAFGCSGQSADVTATSPEAKTLDAVGYDLVTASVSGDFNVDSKSDLVLQTSVDDSISNWFMTNTAPTQGQQLGTPTGWSPVAIADLNGDGVADVVLQNRTTGAVATWIIGSSGLSVQGVYLIASPGSNWKVRAATDFNNDGKADLVMQDVNTGSVSIWLMDGATILLGQSIGANIGAEWVVQGTGDFNADSNPDILLQSSVSGDVVIWIMQGLSITASSARIAQPGTTWQVIAAGDFDGDGKADVLLQNSATSQITVWIMNGTTITTGHAIATPGAGWTCKGRGDFNGDGTADVVIQNSASKQVVVYLMSSGFVSTTGSPVAPNSTYTLMANH